MEEGEAVVLAGAVGGDGVATVTGVSDRPIAGKVKAIYVKYKQHLISGLKFVENCEED